MESSLAEKKFVACLKLPEDLYEYFKQNPELKGELTLDHSQLSLSLSTLMQNEPITLTSNLSKSESLYIFSVDSSKTPHFKGPIDYSGILLNPLHKFFAPKKETKPKPTIQLQDLYKENLTSHRFKLHKNHNVILSNSTEDSIKQEIMKRFGDKRKRDEEHKVITKLKSIFSDQKYWKIRSLSYEILQPESYIREIMKKIGEKVKSGEFRGLWTLKSST